MQENQLARQVLAHLDDEEYAALKVPAYKDNRILATAAFIIAHAKHWVQCFYIRKQKREEGATTDKWHTSQYMVNFKREQANEFAVSKGQHFDWISRGLLPVDWYYRFAMKGEYNIGWINLNNVYMCQAKNGTTGNIERTFMTGLIPDTYGEATQERIIQNIGRQDEHLGFKVQRIDQQAAIDAAMKQNRRNYARR